MDGTAAETAGTTVTTQAVDSIFQQWNSQNTAGCAVGIERKGEPVLIRSYGMADLEHDVPITPATIFEAGSVSKQFTAASILSLAAQGKLALTDEVRKYLPELPEYGAPITINELLGHTSGLRDWGEVEAMAGWPRGSRIYTLADALDVAVRQKSLNFPPGTAFSYNNTGYNLLAIIVERVGKASLAEYTRAHFFAPLGMSHTQWRDDFRRVVKDRAIAYESSKGNYRQKMPFEDVYGHAGLLTTIGDLLIWNDALATGKLGAFVTAELQRPTRLNSSREIAYARGLFLRHHQDAREISHDGSTAGYRAWLGRYPDQQISIALLCNSDGADSPKLAHQIADIFLPPEPTAAPASITLTEAELAPFVGVFVDERSGLPVRLSMRGDSLALSRERLLTPLTANEFRIGASTLRFRDADGFTLDSPDSEALPYRRVQTWTPKPSELMMLAGDYVSDEALATYRVSVAKNGGVVLTPRDRQGQTLILRPLFADTFEYGDNEDSVAHFTHDTHGRVTAFVLGNSRVRALSFRRLTSNESARSEK
jgi:CubicO group peptidase (beta-lactamase class C family)